MRGEPDSDRDRAEIAVRILPGRREMHLCGYRDARRGKHGDALVHRCGQRRQPPTEVGGWRQARLPGSKACQTRGRVRESTDRGEPAA
jgi:hypothetical protein